MEVLYECFSCDYCHRVSTGITIINGFKMCPMCLAEYQHKSGENNKLREELEKQARLIVYQENENAKLKIENTQLKSELESLKKECDCVENYTHSGEQYTFATREETEEALKKLEE
ncbi:MAG: hypothetical protein RR342_03725 [Bacilli bacterium]